FKILRLHRCAKSLEREEVRPNGAAAKLASSGVGERELLEHMEEGSDGHNYASRLYGSVRVQARKINFFRGARRRDHKVRSRPLHAHTETLKHLGEPKDLLYPGYVLKGCCVLIQKGSGHERYRRVL